LIKKTSTLDQDFLLPAGLSSPVEGNMKLMKDLKAVLFVLAICWVTSAHAQDAAGCSNSRLSGDYAFTGSGEIVGVGPLSSIGKLDFDGSGNVTSALVHGVVNGVQPPADFLSGTGTYVVNANCSGKIHLVFDNGVTLDVLIVVARKGHEIRGVNTAPGVNIIANFVKVDTRL
jgi:hypothetical protein